MKINKEVVAKYIAEESNYSRTPWEMLIALIKHFEHSIKDIESYEGLPDEVKQYIPEYIFEELTTCNN